VIGRKRFDVKDVQCCAADGLGTECGDKGRFVHDRPREVLTSIADGFIACSSAVPTIPRVLSPRPRWMVRMSASLNNSCLETAVTQTFVPRECGSPGELRLSDEVSE
jgi:hypothetical protein